MEYISKQSLLADLNEATPRSYFAFETMVREYPTEDVVPVVHAHWIEETTSFYYGCSACKQYEDYKYKYCPNCGAKMDEAEIVGKRMIDGLIDGMGNNVKSVGQQFCNGEE